ncbi:MAG TPA: hypothetical protein VMW93_07230 [bacterium]|nr:hypothetical protein [bacterium]
MPRQNAAIASNNQSDAQVSEVLIICPFDCYFCRLLRSLDDLAPAPPRHGADHGGLMGRRLRFL